MLGRRSFLILGSRSVAAALSFVGLFFMTRYLGPEAYGTVSWTLSLVASFNAISDLGFSSAHIKRISEGKDPGECVSTFAAIKLMLIFAVLLTLSTAIGVWTFVLGHVIDHDSLSLIVLFTLYFVFYSIATIAIMTFQARMEMAKSQISLIIDPAIRLPLIVLFSIGGMSAIGVGYAYVFGGLGLSVLSLFILLRKREISWHRPSQYASYVSFAAPLAVMTIAATISANLDKIVIGTFSASRDVGYYSSGQTFLGFFGMVGLAVSMMTLPLFSKLYAEGQLERIRILTAQAERFISIVSLPLITVIVVFPNEIVKILFGSQFGAAGISMRYLAIATMTSQIYYVHSTQILAINRSDVYAKLTILSIAVNSCLLFVLVPSNILGFNLLGLSYSGAAISELIRSIFLYTATRLTLIRLTGTRLNPRMAIHVLAAIVSAFVMSMLGALFHDIGIFEIAIVGTTGIVIFELVLYVFHELTVNDIRYLLELLSLRKMLGYIRTEFKS